MSTVIGQLFRTLWEICTFRQGPDKLPRNNSLLIGTMAFLVALDLVVVIGTFALAQVLEDRHRIEFDGSAVLATIGIFAVIVLVALGGFAIVYAITHTFLSIANLKERTYKTFFALLGTEGIFNLLGILFGITAVAFIWLAVQQPRWVFPVVVIGGLLLVGFLIWRLIVGAHIFSRSLDITLGRGFLVAIAFIAVLAVIAFVCYLLLMGLIIAVVSIST